MRLVRFLPVALLLALVVLAAGCGGGGSKSVPADAVATVGSDSISKSEFNFLIDGARNQAKAAKATFPKPGTTDFKTLQDKAMAYLVQERELELKGKDLGVTVTDADVDKQIAQIKKQLGGEAGFQAQLKSQGFTVPLLKVYQRGNLLANKLYEKVTKDTKVTDADVKKYYEANKATMYSTTAKRDVRHILVNSKSVADDLEKQLKAGGDFAKLAKKFSKDTVSAVAGGKLTIEQGKTVPEFDKAAFKLKTNEISPPIHTQYGWHIIQALGAVKPASVQPLADVKVQIRANLLSSKKTDQFQKWLDDVKKSYAKDVSYQAGYVPEATTTAATTTQPTTTG
ncbi:MAG: foldase protein PrsA [Gaiellaceae bacterium]|jgi:parvulin-like peptidyl-prolyl isomerase|nr:foldase protein PrsA [Gaiellaceae bacterium]